MLFGDRREHTKKMDVVGIYTDEVLARYKYPFYEDSDQRKESFYKTSNSSTKSLRKHVKDFVTAGFFYTGENDTVTCYDCGLTASGWDKLCNPLCYHLLNSNSCEHIKQVKILGLAGTTLVLSLNILFVFYVDDSKWYKVMSLSHIVLPILYYTYELFKGYCTSKQ